MTTKLIVYLLSLSIFIMAMQTAEATQSLNSSLVDNNNTTLAKTLQNTDNLNQLQKKLSYHMEILGPWKVEFNTSETLSIEKTYLNGGEGQGLLGMNVEGLELWGLSIIDSMDHEVGALIIMDLPRATVMNDEMLDGLIDSVLSGFKVDMPVKTSLEIDGTGGRQGVGYSSMYKRDLRGASYPFQPYYDSFYNQNVSKSLVYYIDLNNENQFNEVVGSLHIERLS
jgi:hypothetical protein